MNVAVFNKDSSFFTVESEDFISSAKRTFSGKVLKSLDRFLSDRVISLSITEQFGQMTTGTILITDPYHVYSRILRNGMRLNITWGFKKWSKDPRELMVTRQKPNELSGDAERHGLNAVIQTPSGAGDQQGQVTYSATFYSSEVLTGRHVKVFTSGTRADAVKDVLKQLGVKDENMEVNFSSGSVKLGSRGVLIQEESSYRFLARMAYEWRVLFRTSFNKKGELMALFTDWDKVGTSKFAAKVVGGKGSLRTLDYKGGSNNVISYTWSENIGENGTGDGVRLTMINGQIVAQRYVAETETITTWEFKPEKMRKELEKKGNIADKTELTLNWLSRKTFKEIEPYFEPRSQSTAPQGFGYKMNVKMLGDPLMTPPLELVLGEGFPDRLRQTDKTLKKNTTASLKDLTKFYLSKATHTIDRNGYQMDIEIGDALTVFGGFVR
jgi:hypothetical protein